MERRALHFSNINKDKLLALAGGVELTDFWSLRKNDPCLECNKSRLVALMSAMRFLVWYLTVQVV